MVGSTTAGLTGVSGVLLTTLMGSGLFGNTPVDMEGINLPLSSVNFDKSILSTWVSEEVETFSDEPLSSECNFFNFTRQYTAEFCDAFTISRMQTGTVRVASDRALRCAAKTQTECVLSPEIGLAIPAVFLGAPTEPSGIRVFIAPRVVDLPQEKKVLQRHVRVSIPSDTFTTRTVVMNDTIKIEYMDTSKTVKSEIISGEDAFCVNLLRISYESSCWTKLDG